MHWRKKAVYRVARYRAYIQGILYRVYRIYKEYIQGIHTGWLDTGHVYRGYYTLYRVYRIYRVYIQGIHTGWLDTG